MLHILRFVDNARQAREMELSYPIGDVGLDSGTVGGFYADSEYGYVMESRKEPLLIREAGTMGETDFLYSANSALHPEAHQAGWMSKPEKWDWHPNGGWRPKEFSFFNKIGMMYSGSSLRSRYFFEMLEQAKGNIDLEYMKTIYRTSGTMPEGDWKKVSRQYRKNGQWGAISGGNASNGVVGVMKPDNGNRGIYALCWANQLAVPHLPAHSSLPSIRYMPRQMLSGKSRWQPVHSQWRKPPGTWQRI